MIDFDPGPELEEIRRRVTQFMNDHVYAVESQALENEGLPPEILRPLQEKVKSQGLWAPHMPRGWGGMGIGAVGLALVNEIVGRSPVAPQIFGCAAPDAGNAELLHQDNRHQGGRQDPSPARPANAQAGQRPGPPFWRKSSHRNAFQERRISGPGQGDRAPPGSPESNPAIG